MAGTYGRWAVLGLAVSAVALTMPRLGAQGPGRQLSRAAFEDKVRGGWAGQMIGVAFGAPTEFTSNGRIIEGDLPAWTPERIENTLEQDDLYVEMTFAAVMDRAGLDATTEQYGEAFRTSQYDLWHANAAARRLLARGIKAPLSGHPKYNVHANDIDFQIEADFIGLMTPGLPRESNKYCDRVGRVMNHGDGLYGGMFVAGMYAAGYFERDVRRVVEAGLATLPAESGYARIIRDVLAWSAEHPSDWRRTWQRIQDTWDRDDSCPDGALADFNIDARLNGAYIALGLLHGEGDFGRTLEISTRAGQDSDCNPSSAAGVLGVMIGYSGIPDEWKRGIPGIADRKFAYTDYSFDEIVASTIARATTVIERAGGRVTAGGIEVPAQAPVAAALEQWDMGVPDRRIGTSDAAWAWGDGWSEVVPAQSGRRERGREARTAGAEATLTFTGSAVILTGRMSQDGGRADVFLDGKAAGEIDAYVPPRTHDNALWHAYDLTPGRHTVRIVTRPDRAPESTGSLMRVDGAVTFRPHQSGRLGDGTRRSAR